jgi:hypothetical protein
MSSSYICTLFFLSFFFHFSFVFSSNCYYYRLISFCKDGKNLIFNKTAWKLFYQLIHYHKVSHSLTPSPTHSYSHLRTHTSHSHLSLTPTHSHPHLTPTTHTYSLTPTPHNTPHTVLNLLQDAIDQFEKSKVLAQFLDILGTNSGNNILLNSLHYTYKVFYFYFYLNFYFIFGLAFGFSFLFFVLFFLFFVFVFCVFIFLYFYYYFLVKSK